MSTWSIFNDFKLHYDFSNVVGLYWGQINPLWLNFPVFFKTYFKYDFWVADMFNVDKNYKNLYMCFLQFVYLIFFFCLYDVDIITNFMFNFHTDSLLLEISIHYCIPKNGEQINLETSNLYHFEPWGNYFQWVSNLGLTVIYLMVFLEKLVKQDSLWFPECAFVYMFIYIFLNKTIIWEDR